MNPQITNLIIMLGMMQVSKRIPFEDPTWLNGIRIAYVLSNVIIVGIYLLVGNKIKAKNGMPAPPRPRRTPPG